MKHTQGKWEIDKDKGQIRMNGIIICHTGCNTYGLMSPENQAKEDEANAKLIAAAPLLLQACKELLTAVCFGNHGNIKNSGYICIATTDPKILAIENAISQAESEV